MRLFLFSICFFPGILTAQITSYQHTLDSLHYLNDSTFIWALDNTSGGRHEYCVIHSHERIRHIIHKLNGNKNKNTLALARILYSSYLIGQKNYGKALAVLSDVMQHPQRLRKKDSMRLYGNLSRAYTSLGVFSRAMNCQEKLEEMMHHGTYPSNDIYPKKSGLFGSFGMYKKAIEWTRIEFYRLSEKQRTWFKKSAYFNNIGVFWNKLEVPDSSIQYFFKALDCANRIKDDCSKEEKEFLIGLIKGNIGQALILKKQFSQAIPYLLEDIYVSRKTNHKENAALSHYEIAKSYQYQKDFTTALQHLDSALQLTGADHNLSLYFSVIETRCSIYLDMGAHERYISSVHELEILRDSMNRIQHKNQTMNQEIVLDILQHEREMHKKETAFELQNVKNEEERVFRNYVLIILLALTAITAILLVNAVTSRKKRKALTENNRKIHEQNQIIEETLKEKDMLIREIHHRVKNNLQMVSSLLNLQSNRVDDEAARIALRESISRIDSMAIIHQQLYGKSDFRIVRMDIYLKELVVHIERSYNDQHNKIDLHIEAEPLMFNLDTAIPVGIAMNEILTNCYKHAFKGRKSGKIQVTFKRTNGLNLLSVTDNGIGLPDDFENKRLHSLGQELIGLLVEQINGKLRIESGNGTSYHITF